MRLRMKTTWSNSYESSLIWETSFNCEPWSFRISFEDAIIFTDSNGPHETGFDCTSRKVNIIGDFLFLSLIFLETLKVFVKCITRESFTRPDEKLVYRIALQQYDDTNFSPTPSTFTLHKHIIALSHTHTRAHTHTHTHHTNSLSLLALFS